MAAKVTVRIGALEFSGEGEEAWVAEQLDKFVTKAPELLKIAPATAGAHHAMTPDASIAGKPLGTFLRDAKATENQNKKFLATAAWLQAKGQKRLKTGDITKALSDNNQGQLGNASQCLADNVKQGNCERDGAQFYVTEEGIRAL
jgi:hypothetical protein